MGSRDVSQLSHEYVICVVNSRVNEKHAKVPRDAATKFTKLTRGGATWA